MKTALYITRTITESKYVVIDAPDHISIEDMQVWFEADNTDVGTDWEFDDEDFSYSVEDCIATQIPEVWLSEDEDGDVIEVDEPEELSEPDYLANIEHLKKQIDIAVAEPEDDEPQGVVDIARDKHGLLYCRSEARLPEKSAEVSEVVK